MLHDLKCFFRSYQQKKFEIKDTFTPTYLMEKKHNWSALIPVSDPNWIDEDFKKVKQKLVQNCSLSKWNILNKWIIGNEIFYKETKQYISGTKIHASFICIQSKCYLKDAWVVMTRKDSISDLFQQKNWKEFIYYTPSKIARALSYEEAFMTSYYAFFHDFKNEELQRFSIKLLFAIREVYPDRWNEDWKNEVFLGNLCEYNCQYDDRYDAYLRAYNKVSHPPANLLILLAHCNICPGVPPISQEESEYLLKEAIKQEKSYEAAHALYWLYKDAENHQEANYWKAMAEEAKEKGWQTNSIIPDIIKKFDPNPIVRETIPT